MSTISANPGSVTNNILLSFFIIFISTSVCAEENKANAPSTWSLFSSTYFEGVRLDHSDTFAGLLVERAGLEEKEFGVETYGVARIGADSRTVLDRSDAIYNDNYFFLGAGVDYLKLISGLRLSAQFGYSFDLSSKIKKAGFDIRAGFMTYHEKRWCPFFRNEIYSEGFYVRRYQDVIFGLQLRSFLVLLHDEADPYKGFEAGPYVNLVGSEDTTDLNYNRFIEAHYGARVRYQAPVTVALQAYGVLGHRLDSGDPVGNYSDFRVLLNGYFEFR